MPNLTSFQLEHQTACPRLRILDPLDWLKDHSDWQISQAVHMGSGRSFNIKADFNIMDIAIFQRHFSVTGCDDLFEVLQSRKIPIIFEIDDDFLNIPDAHPHAAVIRGLEKNLLHLLKIADVVTTTTEILRDIYAPHTKRVEIIRNTLDPKRWQRACRWSQKDYVVMGYSGTTTHVEDLQMIEDVLIRLLDQHGEKLRLKLWGCATPRLISDPRVDCSEGFKMAYHDYVDRFQQEDLDIALAPLLPDKFNDAKSAIKWKEYAIGSVPGVFSRIPSYERVVSDGETGFICDTPEQWEEKLNLLIGNRELREKIGQQCRENVLEQYTIDKAGEAWQKILDEVQSQSKKVKTKTSKKQTLNLSQPKASIIIPVFNRADLTKRCLESIFSTDEGIPFEVIVVDNASTDETQEMLKAWEDQIHVIHNKKNLGFSCANNQASQKARADLLVMLNNDTEVQPGWLQALINCHNETQADLVGARLIYADKKIQHAGVAIFSSDDKPHALYAGLPENHPENQRLTGHRRPFQIVTAACWLVKKSSWNQLGGFDEGFVNGYEDVDFCLRLRQQRGEIWYEPKALILHHESQSSGRGAHTQANEKRLFERWRHQWQHDDHHYFADDGLVQDEQGQFKPNPQLISNLRALEANHPNLAAKTASERFGAHRINYQVVENGQSVLIHTFKKSQLLNSKRNPQQEAERLISRWLIANTSKIIKVIGFGFGWHIESLLKKLEPDDSLEVQIVDPLIFKLALENRSLEHILSDPRLHFVDDLDFKRTFVLPIFKSLKTPLMTCESTIWGKNLKALQQTNIECANWIVECDDSQQYADYHVTSKIARFKDTSLHDETNPKEEAQFLAHTWLQNVPPGYPIKVMGFGLGYHLEALLEKMAPKQPLEVQILDRIIFQLALKRRDLTKILGDPRLKFVANLTPEKDFVLPCYLKKKDDIAKTGS